jgi:hypothetical protein
MVARQTAGEQPLRGGMALLRARCIRQSLPQLARELPNDVLESDQPVGQLARRNPEETPRSEHIQVKLDKSGGMTGSQPAHRNGQ